MDQRIISTNEIPGDAEYEVVKNVVVIQRIHREWHGMSPAARTVMHDEFHIVAVSDPSELPECFRVEPAKIVPSQYPG